MEQSVAMGERHLAQNPDDLDTQIVVENAYVLLKKRRYEFEKHIKQFNAEPVQYTLHGNWNHQPVGRELFHSFCSYEKAVLLTAQAMLTDIPQDTRRLEPSVHNHALRYGYLFSDKANRLGAVMCTQGILQLELGLVVEEEEELPAGHPKRLAKINDKDIMAAAKEVSRIVSLRDKIQITDFGRRRGAAPLAELNEWVTENTRHSLTIETIWGSGSEIKTAVDLHQSLALKSALNHFDETTSSEVIEATGTLSLLNLNTRRFQFISVDGKKYSGRYDSGLFTSKSPAKLPHPCKCSIQVITKYNELTDQATITNKMITYKG